MTGLGVALLPELSCRKALGDGKLVHASRRGPASTGSSPRRHHKERPVAYHQQIYRPYSHRMPKDAGQLIAIRNCKKAHGSSCAGTAILSKDYGIPERLFWDELIKSLMCGGAEAIRLDGIGTHNPVSSIWLWLVQINQDQGNAYDKSKGGLDTVPLL